MFRSVTYDIRYVCNHRVICCLLTCLQGMNEIIGPIYYVFAQHPDPKWKGDDITVLSAM